MKSRGDSVSKHGMVLTKIFTISIINTVYTFYTYIQSRSFARSHKSQKSRLKHKGEKAGRRQESGGSYCVLIQRVKQSSSPTCPCQSGQQQQQQQQRGLHPGASHVTRPRSKHTAIVCPLPSVLSQHHTS